MTHKAAFGLGDREYKLDLTGLAPEDEAAIDALVRKWAAGLNERAAIRKQEEKQLGCRGCGDK